MYINGLSDILHYYDDDNILKLEMGGVRSILNDSFLPFPKRISKVLGYFRHTNINHCYQEFSTIVHAAKGGVIFADDYPFMITLHNAICLMTGIPYFIHEGDFTLINIRILADINSTAPFKKERFVHNRIKSRGLYKIACQYSSLEGAKDYIDLYNKVHKEKSEIHRGHPSYIGKLIDEDGDLDNQYEFQKSLSETFGSYNPMQYFAVDFRGSSYPRRLTFYDRDTRYKSVRTYLKEESASSDFFLPSPAFQEALPYFFDSYKVVHSRNGRGSYLKESRKKVAPSLAELSHRGDGVEFEDFVSFFKNAAQEKREAKKKPDV